MEIAVIDRGSGIKKEHIDNIFNPFFTTKPDGVGLGLAIVSKIIDEHNGKITVRANRPTEAFSAYTCPWPNKFPLPITEIRPTTCADITCWTCLVHGSVRRQQARRRHSPVQERGGRKL